MPSFNPSEFTRVAKELETEIIAVYDEAKGRTAIGRAYYAAFLQGRERVLTVKPSLLSIYPKKEWHRRVQEAFTALGKDKITNLLYELHRRRINADYKLNAPINLGHVQDTIRLADRVVTRIGAV